MGAVNNFVCRLLLAVATVLESAARVLYAAATPPPNAAFSGWVLSSAAAAFKGAQDWLWSLPQGHLAVVIIATSFCGLVSLVLLMPMMMVALFGDDPPLEPLPLPQPREAGAAVNGGAGGVSRCGDPSNGLACMNASTGALLGYVPLTPVTGVAQAIAAARAAQVSWATTTFEQRRQFLRVLRAYLLSEQDDLVGLSMVDTGKTALDAALGEVLPTLEKIRWLLREGEAALRPERRSTGPMSAHRTATVEFAPLGVIGAIAPWNYPLHNVFNPALAALFAGSAIVIKPSEHASWSAVHFVNIIRSALTVCGHSPDLCRLVVGREDVGSALVSGGVDKLFFTGSTAVGRKVALAAAESLTPVVLELGGKDPAVVCDDTDVAWAASIVLRGVFQNAGQNCIGIERVYVQRAVLAPFLAAVVPVVSAMTVRPAAAVSVADGALGADDGDVGALTMGPDAVARVDALVQQAVACGARVLAGGRPALAATTAGDDSTAGGSSSRGCARVPANHYYEPTVLSDVAHGRGMRIVEQEVFGPVLTVIPFDTDAEVVGAINSSAFGLGASVFCRDTRRADALAAAIRTGMVNINDFAVNYLCQSLPFGGVGASGYGRFAGVEGLRGCTLERAVTRQRWWGVRTSIPPPMRFPTRGTGYAFVSELVALVYDTSYTAKVDNVRHLLGMLLFKRWRPRAVAGKW